MFCPAPGRFAYSLAGPSREGDWKLPRAPQSLGRFAIAQKYKVHQNAPYSKEKFKNFLPRGAPQNLWGPHENVFPGPTVALDGPS